MICLQVTITAKAIILPDSQQQEALSRTMRAYADACNYVAGYIFLTHDLSLISLHNELYYPLRSKFGLRSQMAQSVLKTVIAKYRTILENQKEWIRPSFRHPQYDLVWNRDYSLVNGIFSLNTLDGRVKLNYTSKGMEQYFDGAWRFGTAKVIHKHGKWYLHIAVSKEVPEPQHAGISNVVGVDLGINFLAAAYDSAGKTSFYPGREVKHRRGQYKVQRRQLQQRQTPSSRRRLKAIGSRENRWMSDVNHQISKALVDKYPAATAFCIEDLTGVRSATEKVRVKDRYVSVSWAFFDLRKKLEYKAQLKGQMVVAVSPEYTSQACPKCGHTERSNRNKKTHVFCCKGCGYTSNDDRIAAMNLHRKGIQYLSAVA